MQRWQTAQCWLPSAIVATEFRKDEGQALFTFHHGQSDGGGLGGSGCQLIAEVHDDTIGLESAPGGGDDVYRDVASEG